MVQTIGSVLIDVKADTQKLVTGFDKAERTVSNATRNMKTAITGLAAAYLSFEGVNAFAGMVKGSIDAADSLSEVAEKLALTSSGLSELQYTAGFAGVSIGQLDAAMSAMIRRTGNFKKDGTGAAVKAMEELGISVEFAKENFTDTQTTFNLLIDRLRGVEDATLRTKLAQDLFSKSAAGVVRMANMSAKELKVFADEGKRTGAIISDEFAKQAGEVNDTLDRLNGAMGGLSNTLATELAPLIIDTADSLEKNLPKIIEVSKEIGHLAIVLGSTALAFKAYGIATKAALATNAALGGSYGMLNAKIILATASTKLFSKVLRATPFGIAATAIYMISDGMLEASNNTEIFNKTLDTTSDKLKKLTKNQLEHRRSILQAELEEQRLVMQDAKADASYQQFWESDAQHKKDLAYKDEQIAKFEQIRKKLVEIKHIQKDITGSNSTKAKNSIAKKEDRTWIEDINKDIEELWEENPADEVVNAQLITSLSSWKSYFEKIGDYESAWLIEEAKLRDEYVDLESSQIDKLLKLQKEDFYKGIIKEEKKLTKEKEKENKIRYEDLVTSTDAMVYLHQELDGQYRTSGQNLADMYMNLNWDMQSSFTDFFDSTSKGFLDLQDLAKDVGKSIADSMLQQSVIKPLASAGTKIVSSGIDYAIDSIFGSWDTGGYTVNKLKGYKEGGTVGFTTGAITEIAGVVHGGEYVAPNYQVKQYPELFAWLNSQRTGQGVAGAEQIVGLRGFDVGFGGADVGSFGGYGGGRGASMGQFGSHGSFSSFGSSGDSTYNSPAYQERLAKEAAEKAEKERQARMTANVKQTYRMGGLSVEQFLGLSPEYQNQYNNFAKNALTGDFISGLTDREHAREFGYDSAFDSTGSFVSTAADFGLDSIFSFAGAILGGMIAGPWGAKLGAIGLKKVSDKLVDEKDFDRLADSIDGLETKGFTQTAQAIESISQEVQNTLENKDDFFGFYAGNDGGSDNRTMAQKSEQLIEIYNSQKAKLNEAVTADVLAKVNQISESLSSKTFDSLSSFSKSGTELLSMMNSKGTDSIIDEILKAYGTNILNSWENHAKETGSSISDAVKSSLDSLESTKYSLNTFGLGNIATTQFELERLYGNFTNLTDSMSVSGLTLENFNEKYQESISNNFTPDNINKWNTLGSSLLDVTKASQKYVNELNSINSYVDKLGEFGKSLQAKELMDYNSQVIYSKNLLDASFSSFASAVAAGNTSDAGKYYNAITKYSNDYLSAYSNTAVNNMDYAHEVNKLTARLSSVDKIGIGSDTQQNGFNELKKEIEDLKNAMALNNKSNEKIYQILDDVTQGGDALRTEAVS